MAKGLKFVSTTGLCIAAVLLISACSGDDGEPAADGTGSSTIEVDTAELEASITELSEKLDALAQNFVTNDDGSSGFAAGTAPAIVTESSYGYSFPLPEGISPTYVGINDAEANEESGSLLASAGGVSVLLLWIQPDSPLSPGDSVTSSFEVLQANTDANFTLLSAGQDAFTVDGEKAAYATFSAVDDGGATIGIAVIGGWTCEDDGRAFALTVSGTDQESVSASFFELVNAFGCVA